MTELDPELLRLVRETPPETLEQLVLHYVRLGTVKSKRGKTVYVISDLLGNEILRIPYSVWSKDVEDGTPTPAKLVAEALLKTTLCGSCGQRLIDGEDGVCTLCEARQVAELRKLARDLQ